MTTRYLFCLLLLTLVTACSRPGTPNSRPTPANEPAPQARIQTQGSGLYVLDAATLASLGWDADASLALTLNGQPQPYQVRDGKLFFYLAEGTASRYSMGQTLWIRHGEASAAATAANESAPLASLQAMRFFDGHDQYSPKHIEDPWFWRRLLFGKSEVIEVQTPGRAAGTVTLDLSLAGVTNLAHTVVVNVNDAEVDTLEWENADWYTDTLTIEQPAGESLTVTLSVPEVQGDISLVDSLTVSYPSAPNGVEGIFVGRTTTAGQSTFESVGSAPLGWQIAPTVTALPSGDAGTLSLPADATVVITDPSIAKAATAQPVTETALPTDGADYIAVVAPELREAVEPLLEFHRGQGLSTLLLEPQQIYDAYSFGNIDPLAIRAMLVDARATWTVKPRFVLLVGDSTYDPAGFQAPPPTAYVPSPFINTVFGGETVSDNVIADLDDDGYPDIALGRLPARTTEQLTTIINKIKQYSTTAEAGDWRQRVVLVADGQEPIFQHNSEMLRPSIPATATVETVYPAAESDAMAQLLPSLTTGSLIVNYVGHGSVQQWGKDQILTVQEAAELTNGQRLPIFINMTCLTGLFSHPTQESLTEELLWSAKGGAVAAVAPSSLTLPGDQTPLNGALLQQLLSPERPTLGEALITAKRAVVLNGPTNHDILATFNLLGDPALRPAPQQ